MFYKRSFESFVAGAFIGGIMFIFVGAMATFSQFKTGFKLEQTVVGVFFLLAGLGLLIAGIWVEVNLFAHQKKIDPSIPVFYTMNVNGNSCELSDSQMLIDAIENLAPNQSVMVTFSPTYANLVSWIFTKKNGWYISYPTMMKKEQKVQYFTMPTRELKDTVQLFLDVFEDKKTVDFSKLIDMKRYNAVVDMYKLN